MRCDLTHGNVIQFPSGFNVFMRMTSNISWHIYCSWCLSIIVIVNFMWISSFQKCKFLCKEAILKFCYCYPITPTYLQLKPFYFFAHFDDDYKNKLQQQPQKTPNWFHSCDTCLICSLRFKIKTHNTSA